MKIWRIKSNLHQNNSATLFGRSLIIRLAIAVLAFPGIIQSTYANPPICSEIFQNGVQVHHRDGVVQFAYNAQLLNAAGTELNAPVVIIKPWSIRKSCGDDHCTATTGTSQRLYGHEQKTTASTAQVSVPAHSKMTIGDGTANTFSQVTIAEWGTGIISDKHQTYIIDQLQMGYRSKLRLPAGNYWVRHLKLEVESKIEVIGEGSVNFYVIDTLLLPLSFSINENTKNPALFSLYAYKDVQLYVSSRLYGFLHAEGEVVLSHKAKIVGGVIGRGLELKDESLVKYDSLAAQALNFGGLCRGI